MCRHLLVFTVCALILPAHLCEAQCSLTTHFAANTGQAGNMFDLVAQNPAGIEVTGFTVNVDPPAGQGVSSWNFEIYVLSAGGSHVGNEGNPSAWTLIASFNIGSGLFNGPTPLPPLNLPANPSAATWPAGVVANIGPNGGYEIASGATQAFYITVNNGTGINYQVGSTTTVGAVFASTPDLDFLAGVGVAYPFGTTFQPRIWSGIIFYTYPGQVVEYETNTPAAAADISGVFADACTPAVIQRTLISCPGGSITQITDTLTLSTAGNPGAFYEIAADLTPGASLHPATGGGTVLPQNGAIVNLDLLSLSFINGGGTPQLLPMPSFPFATSAAFSVPFMPTGAVDMAVEGVVTNAASTGGFELTQGSEYHVVAQGPPSAIPGPTGDDQVMTFDPTSPPTCWLQAPWTMYGSTFTEMHVDSNGRLLAAFDASDFTPTVSEALSGPPMVGIWTDLSPNVGGSVSIGNPFPGVIDVTWSGVPYFGLAGGSNSFTLEFDDGTGTLSIISDITGGGAPFSSNLTSSGTAGNMFVGITPGTAGPATFSGPIAGGLGFTVSGTGSPALGTHMLYDFLDTTSPGAPNLPVSFNGTALLQVDFLPASIQGVPNYVWSGS